MIPPDPSGHTPLLAVRRLPLWPSCARAMYPAAPISANVLMVTASRMSSSASLGDSAGVPGPSRSTDELPLCGHTRTP